MRHPMYLGALLMFVGAPLLLGSRVGLALGFIMTIMVGFRATGEEKMLMKEFGEYGEYKKRVKFRFIPYIW